MAAGPGPQESDDPAALRAGDMCGLYALRILRLNGDKTVNKFIHELTNTKTSLFHVILVVCALITFLIGWFLLPETSAFLPVMILSGFELLCSIAAVLYFTLDRKNRRSELEAYLKEVTFDSENARNRMLLTFPMPMAVFMLDNFRIVWANEMFFNAAGSEALKFDAKMTDLVPDFPTDWLKNGENSCPEKITMQDRIYTVHGNLVRKDKTAPSGSDMCMTYWVNVTDYEAVCEEYRSSRPVAGIIVIDNYEEMIRNLPDREKNDVRDAIEDRLFAWAASCRAILRRYDRDRYVMVMEKRDLELLKQNQFALLQEMHEVESPNGFSASLSMGFSDDTESMEEAVHFADLAVELALTRGGDQTVIKNRLSFEFYGGRGGEVEKRNKVRSRVMANTIAELIKDSSKVYVMGHRFADLDSIGASAGICSLARYLGIRSHIIVDDRTASAPLIDLLREAPEYRDVFITTQEALQHSDGHTLLIIVDTNRPEQVEEKQLLDICNRVAVIDHHRVAATYIPNAALGYVEPSASSVCELVTEIIQEIEENGKLLKSEADALLAGIVLDTKNFTIRTGEHTFDAASFLRHAGADTTIVKKLLQGDMEDTMQKYRILQTAELYRDVVVLAAPEFPATRIVAAKAADELLNISGVEASIVVVPGENGGAFVSARSIGEINAQILMEKLGGGGNRSAAAAQFPDKTAEEVIQLVRGAVDAYFEV